MLATVRAKLNKSRAIGVILLSDRSLLRSTKAKKCTSATLVGPSNSNFNGFESDSSTQLQMSQLPVDDLFGLHFGV